MTQGERAGIGIEVITPILCVKDLEVSLNFYVNVLGFREDWRDGPLASVSSDGQAIMLSQRAQGQPGTWIWIGVEDVASLYAQFRGRGATIRQNPTNFPWAYEMRIEDPDGHILRFGSEPLDH